MSTPFFRAMVYDSRVMSWSDVSSVGLVVAMLVCSMSAQAAPKPAGQALVAPTLSWASPPGCPGRDAVVRQVEGFLGQPFGAPRPQQISLHASVRQVEDGNFVLQLVAVTAEGESERVLQHGDCSELAKAAALIMAVAIDPELVRHHQADADEAPPAIADGDAAATTGSAPAASPGGTLPTSEWVALLQQPLMCPRQKAETCKPSPPPEPCPVCTEPAPAGATGPSPWSSPVETAVTAAAGSPRWSIWAEAAIASGVLPAPGPTVGAGLGFGDPDHWRLQLYGRYWVGQVVQVPRYRDAGVALRMLSAGASICAVPFASAWRMLGCVSPQIGDLRSAGQGDDMRAKSTDYRLWTALTGSVGAEFPFGSRFFLTTSVEGGWAPRAIEIFVDDAGQKRPLGVAETRRFVADLAARLGVTLD